MNSVNSVVIVGEVNGGGGGSISGEKTNMLAFQVNCKEYFKDKEGNQKFRTEYVNVKAWGNLATECGPILPGMIVAVQGSLRTESWNDKDGVKKYKTVVNANKISIVHAPNVVDVPQQEIDYFQQ